MIEAPEAGVIAGVPGELRRLWFAWPTLFRIAVAEMVAYRAEMIIWILSATLPLVMLALWNAASASGPLAGVTQTDFGRYFAVTLVVRQLTGTWIVWELNYQIRNGSLSPALLRPINPLWYNLAETLAALPWRLAVLAPILAGLWWWKPEIVFLPSAAAAAGFAVSVVLALLLSWLVQCIFGLAAFWFDQSIGLFSVYFAVWALMSGYVVPLPMLPDWFQAAVGWLPWYGTLGAPVGILTGQEPHIVRTLAIQGGWVVLLVWATMTLWRRGLVRYGAVGA